MDDLEKIRQEKMAKIQAEADSQKQQQERLHQAELQLESALRSMMTPEAKSRLTNIQLVNKDLYLKISQLLLQLAKSGQIQSKISDEELKLLLQKISSQNKKDFNIKRI